MHIKNLYILVIILFISSCKFSEEIYFKENGKIDYKYSMVSNMGGLINSLDSSFSSLNDSSDIVSSEDDKATKNETKFKMNMDTIIYFREIVDSVKKDLIAKKNLTLKEKEALKYIDYMKLFSIKMKVTDGDFEFGILASDLLDSTLNFSTKVMSSKAIKEAMTSGLEKMNTTGSKTEFMGEMNLKWDKKTMLYPGYKIDRTNSKSKSKKAPEEAMMDMMMTGSFTRIFKFDKPIKSINIKNALISDDKRSVTITYDMDEFEKKQNAEEIKVELE